MAALSEYLVQFRQGCEPHERVPASRLVTVRAMRHRKSPQERVRLEDRELRHAQEVRDCPKFFGLDTAAVVLQVRHSAGINPQPLREVRGPEPRPPLSVAGSGDRWTCPQVDSISQTCGNRKSLSGALSRLRRIGGERLAAQRCGFPRLFAALTGRSRHGLAHRPADSYVNRGLSARPLDRLCDWV